MDNLKFVGLGGYSQPAPLDIQLSASDVEQVLKQVHSDRYDPDPAGLSTKGPVFKGLDFHFDSSDDIFSKSCACIRKFKAGDKVRLNPDGRMILLTEVLECGAPGYLCIKWRGIDRPATSGSGYFQESALTAA